MALLQFVILFVFVLACWWCTRWVLHRFLSSKPWHRWIRYLVWFGFVGLFTFDTIYYQVAVVDGLCEENQKRVYPAPPSSLVVSGPYTDIELKELFLQESYQKIRLEKDVTFWPCEDMATHKTGDCLVKGIVEKRLENKTLFYDETGYLDTNSKTDEIYSSFIRYSQTPQWITQKLFGFGIGWLGEPKACAPVMSTRKKILINGGL